MCPAICVLVYLATARCCRPHQGLILDASPLIWRDMEQLPHVDDLPQQQAGAGTVNEQEPGSSGSGSSARGLQHPVWLALDEVMDPVSSCHLGLGPFGLLRIFRESIQGLGAQLVVVVVGCNTNQLCVAGPRPGTARAHGHFLVSSMPCSRPVCFLSCHPALLAVCVCVCPAAKPGGHAALRLLPGGVRCAGLLQELCASQSSGQQGISRSHGAHDAAQLQVSG